jgi:hypothetical protein
MPRVPGDPGGPGIPKPELSCDSQECQSALAAVAVDRNRVLSKCAQVQATRSRMNLMAAIAAFFFGLATALAGAAIAAAAAGGPYGVIAAWVLAILAISAFATGILFGIFAAIGAAQLAVQQGELNGERTRFTNDVSTVVASCPSSCWGDTSLPPCPGE